MATTKKGLKLCKACIWAGVTCDPGECMEKDYTCTSYESFASAYLDLEDDNHNEEPISSP